MSTAQVRDTGARQPGRHRWRAGGSGTGPTCWCCSATDRERLASACATLNRHGIAARAAQEGGPEQVTARLVAAVRARFPDADGACVFWTSGEESTCLGPDGWLHRPLAVHVHGPGVMAAAAAAFEEAGLAVAPGPIDGVLFIHGSSADEDGEDAAAAQPGSQA